METFTISWWNEIDHRSQCVYNLAEVDAREVFTILCKHAENEDVQMMRDE